MKLIVELDNNQLHYIRTLLGNEIHTIEKDPKREPYFDEYRGALNDILKQFK